MYFQVLVVLAEVQVGDSDWQVRVTIVARLQARSSEIEEAILVRVNAIGEPREVADPEYLHGFRGALRAAIGYGFAAIDCGEKPPPPVPVEVLTQARVAARCCVRFDAVVRRYVAGRETLGKFLIEEVERDGSGYPALTALLSYLDGGFDRLLAELGAEYERESRARLESTKARSAERVKRLLAGEQLDVSDLYYDFRAHHLGLVTEGADSPAAVRDLSLALDGRLLLIHPAEDIVWAWIGLRRQISREDLDGTLKTSWSGAAPLALGEIGTGPAGWRRTNDQARSVFHFALRDERKIARYVDKALLTSLARDDTITASLRQIYLDPLEHGRDRGETVRQTLRAYFASGRNGNTAAAALGVSRQTVSNRLRSVEQRIGLSLLACATDLELALRLADHGLV
jgi:hypothetical protein